MGRGKVGAGKERWTLGNEVGRRGLTMHARPELSGKHRNEGRTSLLGRLGATMGTISHMATLATDGNRRTGKEALHQVET